MRLRAGALGLVGAVLLLGALTSPALADYEQVPEHFAVSGEAQQLQNSTGMAVNESGAGGVPAGSFYVVGRNHRVVRFTAGSEGEEPAFEEAWGWGIAVGGPASAYVRCGPAYEGSADPITEHTYEHCKAANPNAPFGGEEVGHFETLVAVAVDQTTGYVYVRNTSAAGSKRKHHMIEVFTATGTPVGEGFGDVGFESLTEPESIEEGPEKLHLVVPGKGAIAVDDAGTVYLTDTDYPAVEPGKQSRVMSFKPQSPGDYEHYVYAGQEEDIVTTPMWASQIALVGNDRIVAAEEELIRSYPLQAGKPAPLCSLAVKGQLYAMTANRLSGEVFYYTFSDRKIHRLSACNEETGKFTELQAVKPSPTTQEMFALALNPTLHWGPLRPAGVLYAADAEAHTEPVQKGIGDVLAPAKGAGKALTVVKAGSGAGTVTSSPAGIDCGATCTVEFLEGSKVTLSAKAAEDSTFAGWSGACSGKGTCEVTMSEAKSVTASFEEESEEPGISLKVAIEGSGTVSSDTGLISCTPFCEDEYPEGAKVILTASPSGPSSLFVAWKHCDSGGVNGRQCTVSMSKAKEVSAVFAIAHVLTLAKAEGSGPGKLQSYGGSVCLYACTSALATLKEGTAATVTQTPARHFHFAGWGGDCSGTGSCELSMGEDHDVSASFAPDTKLSLSLSKEGGGQALIKTKPAGLLCGFICPGASAAFYEGEAITLSWKLNKGTTKLTWAEGAGTCTGSSEALEGSCTVSMDAAKELVAALE